MRSLLPRLLALFSLVLVVVGVGVLADGTSSFSTSATVTNTVPTVTVDLGQSDTPSAGTSKTMYVFFNASDQNGASDLDVNGAQVVLNISGETSLTSTTCTENQTIDSTTKRYRCEVTLQYFHKAGQWSVNASINDSANQFAYDFTRTLTINSLDSVAVRHPSISFSGSPGTSDIASTPEPQALNNTGNTDYTSINITGYDFVSGGNIIGVDNVTANSTDSNGLGLALANDTSLALANTSLARGQNNNRTIYFWLDIPSGQAPGSYSSQQSWVLLAVI